MTSAATYSAAEAILSAVGAVDAFVERERERMDEEAAAAREMARLYAEHLAAGGDPWKVPDRTPATFRPRSELVNPYVGLMAVYAAWNRARGSRNPLPPFNRDEWQLAERLFDSFGKPIEFSRLKSHGLRSSDAIQGVLVKIEQDSGDSVVARRTKVDGKVAFLLRDRRDDDPPPPDAGAWRRKEILEEQPDTED